MSSLIASRTSPAKWRIIGPLIALAIAGGAVARFATAGHDGASRSVVAGPAAAPNPVSEAAVALRDAIETGDPSRYAAVDQALTTAGDAPGAPAIHAALLLSRHQFTAARTFISDALAKNPGDRALLGAAVDASVETGDYSAASQQLQTLVDLRPDGRALTRVSYLRELHGDMSGALAAMRQAEQAASESTEHATIITFLGDLCLTANDLSCAEASYTTALQQRPNSTNAALGQARLLAARGNTLAAIDKAAALVARSPQPAAASLLGELRLATFDTPGANEAFALVKANTRLLSAAGVVTDLEAAIFEADHGDAGQAVALATSAYTARHTLLTADALGWALTQAKRANEALPYVRESLALGTSSTAIHIHAAAAFLQTGDAARATDELRIALRSNPWTSPNSRSVGIALSSSLSIDLPESWRP